MCGVYRKMIFLLKVFLQQRRNRIPGLRNQVADVLCTLVERCNVTRICAITLSLSGTFLELNFEPEIFLGILLTYSLTPSFKSNKYWKVVNLLRCRKITLPIQKPIFRRLFLSSKSFIFHKARLTFKGWSQFQGTQIKTQHALLKSLHSLQQRIFCVVNVVTIYIHFLSAIGLQLSLTSVFKELGSALRPLVSVLTLPLSVGRAAGLRAGMVGAQGGELARSGGLCWGVDSKFRKGMSIGSGSGIVWILLSAKAPILTGWSVSEFLISALK